MKNSIYKIVVVLVLFGTGSSCTKLDEEVFSSIPSDKFFTNEYEAMTNVGRVYAHMRKITDRWGAGTLDLVTTDECIIPFRETNLWWDNGLWIDFHRHQFTSVNSVIGGAWSFCFDGISMSNQIIYQLEKSPVDFEAKAKVLAEVKMARAFFYYKALDWFGNIPITTDFKEVTLPAQRSRKDVFAFVLNEITTNLPALDATANANNYGRFTQAGANMMLAKMYINAESWIGTPMWDETISATNAIIAKGQYSLPADYFSNFKIDNQGSSENIFVVPYDKINTSSAQLQLHLWTLHNLSQQTFNILAFCWDGYAAMEDFYKSYDKDDERIKSWLEGPQFSSTGMPLMLGPSRQLTYRPKITSLYSTSNPALLDDGVRFQKYEYEAGLRDGQSMSNDWVVFRYADALLMKAEAEMRKNGNTANSTALDLVNQVRFRAYGNYDHDYTMSTLTMKELLAERGREFSWEFHRRQDLIRFGEWTKAWFEKAAGDSHENLFPIPSWALDLNRNLNQNDGYPR
ncbi:RagB/SusD family nutrient uptake outer membrane protein [Pedobacter sp. V48]|uniref:RagB/SusD family nutrient uptake outer membrane protein n=1 Tax=Pedobacter sp. V48 TaxID=509635 RepID=UPI0003E55BDB|nr:RagB/SusD family nutrient uptake outer membrane protein [Pedobacter sp. V48]ETZ20952.1 hypothetical protein N824_02245 [Pedobacter sp. V48]